MEFVLILVAVAVVAAIILLILNSMKKKKIREHAVGKDGKIGEVDIPREKSTIVAYIFLMIPPIGQLGGQRYYLGKFLTGLLYTFTMSLLGLGWLIDIFLIPRMTRNTNRKLWENWFAKQSDKWTESTGTVRDFSMSHQSDMAGQTVTPKQVMSFRVEETDERGDVVKVIEVELIGNRISGNLRNGDKVNVRGKMSQQNILRALSVENQTTNSRVMVSF